MINYQTDYALRKETTILQNRWEKLEKFEHSVCWWHIVGNNGFLKNTQKQRIKKKNLPYSRVAYWTISVGMEGGGGGRRGTTQHIGVNPGGMGDGLYKYPPPPLFEYKIT